MTVKITDEQANLFSQNGFDDESLQQTIDDYRKEGMSDDKIQERLNAKTSSWTNEKIPQDISQGENKVFALGAEKNVYNPEQVQKNKWWHPVLNVLPPAGAVIGGLAGEGVGSIPLATGGAMAGEQLKQLIEAMSGQRRRMDAGEVAKQAAFGAAGEGIGQGAGKVFETVQPKIAEVMAGISKEDYLRALQSIKQNNSIFSKGNKVDPKNVISQIRKATDEVYPVKGVELPADIFNTKIRGFGEKISSSVSDLRSKLGEDVGEQVQSLKGDAPVRKSEINNIIKEVIANSGKGSKINPTATRSANVISFINHELGKLRPNVPLRATDIRPEEYQELLDYGGEEYAKRATLAQGKTMPEPPPTDWDIDRVGLHNIKHDLQHQVKYNDEYKPSKAFIKDISGKIDDILRENPKYAKANDKFRQLMQYVDENPWIEDPDQIATKLHGSQEKAGVLFDTENKLKNFEKILPAQGDIMTQLSELFKNKSAREELLSKNKEIRKMLPESVIKRPENIRTQPVEVQDALAELNNLSKNSKFGEQLSDMNTQQSFSGVMPKYLAHILGRNAGKVGALGASAALGGGALMHNPFVMPAEVAVMSQMSPTIQKLMLQLHGLSTNAKLGGGLGSSFGEMVSPEQSAYEQALKTKVTKDGSIPASQFKQQRGIPQNQ